MVIPAETRADKRPKNTVAVSYGKDKNPCGQLSPLAPRKGIWYPFLVFRRDGVGRSAEAEFSPSRGSVRKRMTLLNRERSVTKWRRTET